MESLLRHAVQQARRAEARRGADTPQYESGGTSDHFYTLDVHSLWGEDFMDVFLGEHVWQAYRFPRA